MNPDTPIPDQLPPTGVAFRATGPSLIQIRWLNRSVATTIGVGLTVMVNVRGVPVQVTPPLVKLGVTVIVATTGVCVVFTAVKAAMLPLPEAARPIEGVLLVQLYTVPVTAPLNVTAVVADRLHTTWLDTAFTVGIGFTTTVAVIGVPVQPLALGVIVKVTVTGAVVVLVSVPEILPVPLAAMPVTAVVLSRVQL